MTTTRNAGRASRLDVFDLAGLGLLHAIGGVFVLAWWALLFPVISIPLVLVMTAAALFGWPVGFAVAGVSVAGIMLWRQRRPEMFERWITRRARTRFLAWSRYRRCWVRLMTACHLAVADGDRIRVPRLLAVRIGEATDRVSLRMLPGQCPADYDNRVENLAHAFGAQHCHAAITGPATVELVFRHSDALAETVILPRVDQWTTPKAA